MKDKPTGPGWLTPHRLNALIIGLIALGILVGGRFLLSDPHSNAPIHLSLPGGNEISLFACPFRTLTGLPCPICGITRSVLLALRGDISASFRTHPLGLFVVLGAVFGILYGVLALWTPALPETGNRRLMSWLIIAAIVAAWMISLARHFQLIAW